MRKFWTGALGFVMVVAMAGCGASPEAVVQEELDSLTEMKNTLDTIKDDASADAALPKLDSAAARVKAANEKLSKLSGDAGTKAFTAKKPELEKVQGELMMSSLGAMMKAPGKAKQIQ